MGYTQAVVNLSSLTDEQFQAIPDCNEDVIKYVEPSKIESKEQAWIFELCRAISPELKDSFGRPCPRIIPRYTVKKGGECLVFVVLDRWRGETGEEVILKVPLPLFCHDAEKAKREASKKKAKETVKSKEILRGRDKIRAAAEFLYRKLEPPRKKNEPRASPLEWNREEIEEQAKHDHEKAASLLYTRAERAVMVQRQLHRQCLERDPDRLYGYIPEVYKENKGRKFWFTQEFVRGTKYLDYVSTHNDDENLRLFLRIVLLIENVVHASTVAHCDLNHRNIIIDDDTPVLLDFGISKVPSWHPITIAEYSQLGDISSAPKRQLDDSLSRGYWSDIFALGRLFCTTWMRRAPNFSGLLVTMDPKTRKLEYDEDEVNSLYELYAIPEDMRYIYEKCIGGVYEDITELRADVESHFFPTQKTQILQAGCASPCDALVRLYKVVGSHLGLDLEKILEEKRQ